MSHFDRKKTEWYYQLQKLDLTDCFSDEKDCIRIENVVSKTKKYPTLYQCFYQLEKVESH
jgi:hypothetical protein